MDKDINHLSAEEFSHLFPVEIVPYNPAWVDVFEKEKQLLTATLSSEIALLVEHFGSTAVPGLASKPIIDILLEVPPMSESQNQLFLSRMKSIGYVMFTRVFDRLSHIMFAKGYNTSGEHIQIFHLHAGQKDDSLWDRLYFRDYLIAHPETMKEYELLKLQLAGKYKFDRDNYSYSKTEYIINITKKAKSLALNGTI
ncbi:MAG: GrpB family protein [Bacteroidales bacterium]|nr:GrpB family protein [Bacteroidales bacterium]